jgi:hypothetical protein
MGRESDIDIQIRTLEQQVKALHQVASVQKRKERTRRLIQEGCVVGKVFRHRTLGCE